MLTAISILAALLLAAIFAMLQHLADGRAEKRRRVL